MKIDEKLKRAMLSTAGYRERFAMENGTPKLCNAGNCIKFVYSDDLEYQDANGATYHVERKTWIN